MSTNCARRSGCCSVRRTLSPVPDSSPTLPSRLPSVLPPLSVTTSQRLFRYSPKSDRTRSEIEAKHPHLRHDQTATPIISVMMTGLRSQFEIRENSHCILARARRASPARQGKRRVLAQHRIHAGWGGSSAASKPAPCCPQRDPPGRIHCYRAAPPASHRTPVAGRRH